MPMSQHHYSWPVIFSLALKHKSKFIIANVISIVTMLIYLPVPLIIPSLINEVLLKQPGIFTNALSYVLPSDTITPAMIMVSAFLCVLTLRIIEEALKVLQSREFKYISKDIVYQMREKLLLHLNTISIKEYEALGGGKLASYYLKDLDVIDTFLGTSISQAVIAILALMGIITVLLVINWKIALFIFFFNPLSLILMAKFAKKLKQLKSKEHRAYTIFQDALIETIDAIMQIRADHVGRTFINRLINKARVLRDHSIAFEWKSEVVGDLAGMLLFIGVDLYYIVCMVMILLGELTIGMMIALLQYVFQVQHYMTVLINMQSSFYAADAALTRINEALNLSIEECYREKINPFIKNVAATINLKNVNFRYLAKKPILNAINMQFKANRLTAVVGPSGAGKSSLIQALLGFYPIENGEILIDNTNIYDIGFDLIRNHICTVLQNPIIFNDTIRNNLTYGENIDEQILWDALKRAQLHDTIINLTKQLDTSIGKNGIRLSGGQKQRLAIARMLLRPASVVILDEATSALDSKTEYQLYQAISSYLVSKTAIIITHRLSTIVNADYIYVINNGKVVEQGKHQQLLTLKGIYYSLYTLQTVKNH
jgi:ATP-binding cassette, subfamily C, bacterial